MFVLTVGERHRKTFLSNTFYVMVIKDDADFGSSISEIGPYVNLLVTIAQNAAIIL